MFKSQPRSSAQVHTRFNRVEIAARTKRGRPQGETASPLGRLILQAMRLFDLTYQDIASESGKLALRQNNADMRIGKSTLGNIISGAIRTPGGAKLDSLKSILNLSRSEIDQALGFQSEWQAAEQLELKRTRTHELAFDVVTRQRLVNVPILSGSADLTKTQFLDGMVQAWARIEAEYLSAFYPPNLIYIVVGDQDTFASPIAPPGSRLLVDTFLTKIEGTTSLSFHERPLFYALTPHGFTCSYLEISTVGKIVLLPHPLSGHVRQELNLTQVQVIGQVVGLLFLQ
jgi:hypothetical protein